jgi:hypothetical protein
MAVVSRWTLGVGPADGVGRRPLLSLHAGASMARVRLLSVLRSDGTLDLMGFQPHILAMLVGSCLVDLLD